MLFELSHPKKSTKSTEEIIEHIQRHRHEHVSFLCWHCASHESVTRATSLPRASCRSHSTINKCGKRFDYLRVCLRGTEQQSKEMNRCDVYKSPCECVQLRSYFSISIQPHIRYPWGPFSHITCTRLCIQTCRFFLYVLLLDSSTLLCSSSLIGNHNKCRELQPVSLEVHFSSAIHTAIP